MNFEPQKFFIGLIDFFSVLLPGALFTYLLKDHIGPLLHQNYGKIADTEGWIVFLFSSYLLGHFIFLLGSVILDDHVYRPIRTATYPEQIKRLAAGRPLPWRFTRWLAGLLISKEEDHAVYEVVRIKQHYLDPLGTSSAINAFQWCKAKLMLDHSQAMATVQRFEADSKFFRSLFIVLVPMILIGLAAGRPLIAAVGVVFLGLAFWRYVDQRSKSTSQAYWYVITAEAQSATGYRRPPPDYARSPSHAGGVVYHFVGEQPNYLLVRPTHSNDTNEWVLPKGHIEPDESMEETAVREVREEAGVWACIEAKLQPISFIVNGTTVNVQFYLMKGLEQWEPNEAREPSWFEFDEALTKLEPNPESQSLLRFAETRRLELRIADASRKVRRRTWPRRLA